MGLFDRLRSGASGKGLELHFKNVESFNSLTPDDIEFALLLTEHTAAEEDLSAHFIEFFIPQAAATTVFVERAIEQEQIDEAFLRKTFAKLNVKRSDTIFCQYVDTREGSEGPSSRFIVILRPHVVAEQPDGRKANRPSNSAPQKRRRASSESWGVDLRGGRVLAARLARNGHTATIVDLFVGPPHQGAVNRNEAIRAFVQSKRPKRDQVVLSLPADATLSRVLAVPPSVQMDGTHIQYEARQQIPFDLAGVVWDAFLTPHMVQKDARNLLLMCVRRDLGENWLSIARNGGLRAKRMIPASLAIANYLSLGKPDGTPMAILPETEEFSLVTVTSDYLGCTRLRTVTREEALGQLMLKRLTTEHSLSHEQAHRLLVQGPPNQRAATLMVQTLAPVLKGVIGSLHRYVGLLRTQHTHSDVDPVIMCFGSVLNIPGMIEAVDMPFPVYQHRRPEALQPAEPGLGDMLDRCGGELAVACGLALQGIGLAPFDLDLLPPGRWPVTASKPAASKKPEKPPVQPVRPAPTAGRPIREQPPATRPAKAPLRSAVSVRAPMKWLVWYRMGAVDQAACAAAVQAWTAKQNTAGKQVDYDPNGLTVFEVQPNIMPGIGRREFQDGLKITLRMLGKDPDKLFHHKDVALYPDD